MSLILTCNAGSTNTKLAAFDAGTLARVAHTQTYNETETMAWLCSVGEPGVAAIGHRVVHGGREFSAPVRLTPPHIETLRALSPLAPLHQPAALHLIAEAGKLYPQAPQIACFDTAFHHGLPDIERRLPLPQAFQDAGMMRYGFHGLSYQHVMSQLGARAEGRVVVAHLGGGSSACALHDGASVATTMGFSTLDGMMMATRPGALDAGAVLHMLQELNMTAEQVGALLYSQSGLKGVSGISGDMRELVQSEAAAAKLAIALYCRSAARQIASLLPALGGLDLLVFTGGTGQHQPVIRENIVAQLRWAGGFGVDVVPTDEEQVIALACRDRLQA